MQLNFVCYRQNMNNFLKKITGQYSAVMGLKYCQYGVKHYLINQSTGRYRLRVHLINQSTGRYRLRVQHEHFPLFGEKETSKDVHSISFIIMSTFSYLRRARIIYRLGVH